MSDGVTLDYAVHFTTGRTGQRVLSVGEKPLPAPVPAGRVPRISRLMALAIRFDNLVRIGEVADFADIAELGQVTRARISQIVNLLNLAPDIQEEILHLPRAVGERDTVSERDLREIAGEPDWGRQREMWQGFGIAVGCSPEKQSSRNRTTHLWPENTPVGSEHHAQAATAR